MPTALDLTPEQRASFQAAARRRHQQEQAALERRQQRAWELARLAAALLRAQFGAKRVVVFGSLVHPGSFTQWSDVDIAAWGIQPADTFRAMGAAMDLGAEIEVNLVDVATAAPSLLAVIEREGVEV